jgi:hypothetical protein
MTKFRAGLAAGLALGYYLGARAGRERYDQLNRAATRVLRRSPKVDQAAADLERARAVIDLTRERVQDAADHLLPGGLTFR